MAHSVETSIPWPQPTEDDLGFWSAANPTRFTVPQGVRLIKVVAQVAFQNGPNGDRRVRAFLNNNTVGYGLPAMRVTAGSNVDLTILNVSGSPIPVVPGDYVEIRASQNNNTTLNLAQFDTWASVEVVR